jgi:hypothetical protein
VVKLAQARLDLARVAVLNGGILSTDNFTYDALGNLTSRTGVGTYVYNATRPFQLDAVVTGPAISVINEWDNAGNLSSRRGGSVPGTEQGFE